MAAVKGLSINQYTDVTLKAMDMCKSLQKSSQNLADKLFKWIPFGLANILSPGAGMGEDFHAKCSSVDLVFIALCMRAFHIVAHEFIRVHGHSNMYIQVGSPYGTVLNAQGRAVHIYFK